MITAVHGIIQSQQQSSAYLPLTTAWIAETGESDVTIIDALNTLEQSMINNSLTSKIKAFYPFVGGNATKHKYNFMNAVDSDTAFRLTFNGGWTHSSTGAKPNGTNGWADTYLNPTIILSQDSVYMGMYSRTNISELSTDMGNNVINPVFDLELYLGVFYSYINGPLVFAGAGGTNGYFSTSRYGATDSYIAKDGSSIASTVSPSTGCVNGNIMLATSTVTYFSSKELAGSIISEGLTNAEDLILYNLLQTFNTSLNRQV